MSTIMLVDSSATILLSISRHSEQGRLYGREGSQC